MKLPGKKILSKEQIYAKRIKIKRTLCNKFNKEWKRKRAVAQAKWRRKRKEQKQSSTQNISSSNSYDLRKKRRSKTTKNEYIKIKK